MFTNKFGVLPVVLVFVLLSFLVPLKFSIFSSSLQVMATICWVPIIMCMLLWKAIAMTMGKLLILWTSLALGNWLHSYTLSLYIRAAFLVDDMGILYTGSGVLHLCSKTRPRSIVFSTHTEVQVKFITYRCFTLVVFVLILWLIKHSWYTWGII